jgi:hypothetical protein
MPAAVSTVRMKGNDVSTLMRTFQKVTRYHCNGYQSVEAASAHEAAATFFGRLAHREFGKSGHARALRLDSWSEDESCFTYAAYIGVYNPRDRITTGRNEYLIVTRD